MRLASIERENAHCWTIPPDLARRTSLMIERGARQSEDLAGRQRQ
jgi:hypothetical protein